MHLVHLVTLLNGHSEEPLKVNLTQIRPGAIQINPGHRFRRTQAGKGCLNVTPHRTARFTSGFTLLIRALQRGLSLRRSEDPAWAFFIMFLWQMYVCVFLVLLDVICCFNSFLNTGIPQIHDQPDGDPNKPGPVPLLIRRASQWAQPA